MDLYTIAESLSIGESNILLGSLSLVALLVTTLVLVNLNRQKQPQIKPDKMTVSMKTLNRINDEIEKKGWVD